MGLDYIMIPAEYAEIFEKMPAEDVGAAVMALMAYNRTGERPEGLSAIADIAYTILEINYNRVIAAQKAKSEAQSSNGKKGGRPRKSAGESECEDIEEISKGESQEKPTKANESQDDFQKANESQEKPTKANESQKSNKNKIKENKINKNNIYFNTPLSPLLGGEGAVDEKSGNHGFDRFWEAYPRKVGKKAALSAFKRARCPTEKMLQALERQKSSPQWRKDGGAYIPNPTTWLNQGRWDDAPEEPAHQAEAPAESGYTLSAAELAAIANLQALRDNMAAGG